jgi:hypothetical protein
MENFWNYCGIKDLKMADKKISQLTAIDAVNVATNDVLAIVDIDAGSDGTKKITVEELRKLIVALYNGADIKIATSGTGVDVTGTATMDVPADGDIAIFKEGSDTVGTIGAKANDLFIQTGGFGIRFTDAANAIRPCDATGGANAVMDIGDATVPWRNLYLSGNVIVDSGKGIDFSADGQAAGMTSELLDDYEEGTWTPVYLASVSGTATYGIQTGYYRKIGSVVFAAFRIRGNKDTLSGDLRIDGLPYAPAPNETTNSVSISWAANFASNMPELRALASGSSIRLYKGATDTTPVRLTDADLSGASVNNNEIRGVAIYFTA